MPEELPQNLINIISKTQPPTLTPDTLGKPDPYLAPISVAIAIGSQ